MWWRTRWRWRQTWTIMLSKRRRPTLSLFHELFENSASTNFGAFINLQFIGILLFCHGESFASAVAVNKIKSYSLYREGGPFVAQFVGFSKQYGILWMILKIYSWIQMVSEAGCHGGSFLSILAKSRRKNRRSLICHKPRHAREVIFNPFIVKKYGALGLLPWL